MNVADVLSEQVPLCWEVDSLDVCMRRMCEHRVDVLPVISSSGRVVGIVTDRDLVLNRAKDRFPPKAVVRDVMSQVLATADLDEDLEALQRRLARTHKRCAVVVDEAGGCLGVVRMADIAGRLSKSGMV